jgi:hypothetical protein
MRRFHANGRITNYEIADLRATEPLLRGGCRTRWNHLWASLSDVFHPRSLKEWENR